MFKIPNENAENVMFNQEVGTWWKTPSHYLDRHNDHMNSLTLESHRFGPFSDLFCSYGDSFQKLNRHCSESSIGISDYNRVDDDDDNVVGLSKVLSGISIFDEQGNGGFGGTKTRGFDIVESSYTLPCSSDAHVPFFSDETGTSHFGTPNESFLNLNHGKKFGSTSCYALVQHQKPCFSTTSPCDHFVPSAMDFDSSWESKSPFIFSQPMQSNLAFNPNTALHCDPVVFNCDNSYASQLKHVCFDNVCICNSLRGCINESNVPQQLLLNLYSLNEDYGCIYRLAKDQHGCRFLQRVIDEGTSEDMRIVFEGVIDNVVELMMDPFGNYLVQKLLHVCREDQILNIVLMLTKEPRLFVKTSLNTHGTRVVQKLIETLSSRSQMLLVRSAILSGFIDLTKDINGNHVIQSCLHCFSCQDNELIFEAAAKFCVEIATHRYGCCVLQRCITYSMGKYQNKLVKEICKYGLLLAQDPFGNYVVQHIIETGIPSASNNLVSQFKGNYINLSMQKFSSHVVEKCLKHVVESRSIIVKELLSAPHFEHLLQDPYANYVVQSALAVTKGSLHASLVAAVRSHQIFRSSLYCKKIFSGNLLRK